MKIGAQSAGNGELKWSYFHVPTALSAKDASLAAEDARLATSTLQRLTVHIIIRTILGTRYKLVGHRRAGGMTGRGILSLLSLIKSLNNLTEFSPLF